MLVYTTLNHIKYCLPNGDSGIIRTLEVPVYVTKVAGDVIHCLDRDGRNRQIKASGSAQQAWQTVFSMPEIAAVHRASFHAGSQSG